MNVLFVCVHNAGRSQMAEALFNHEALKRGIGLVAGSAGTVAGMSVNTVAVTAMEELGVDMSQAQPKQLTQEMVDACPRIISMGCGVDAAICPAKFFVTEEWELDDPADQPIEKVRSIRDEIAIRISRLLEELEEGA